MDDLATRLATVESNMLTQTTADARFLQSVPAEYLTQTEADALYEPIITGDISATDFLITGTTFRSGGEGSLKHATNALLCLTYYLGQGYSLNTDGFSYGSWSHVPELCSVQHAGSNNYIHYNTHPSAPSYVSGFTRITW